jgi:hypothetical protein
MKSRPQYLLDILRKQGNHRTKTKKTVIVIDSNQYQLKIINKLLAIIIDKNQLCVYSLYAYYIGCPTRYRTRPQAGNRLAGWLAGWLADRCSVSQQLGALQTHTTDTFLLISHTTNVPLFKFRCNIFISGFGSEWDTLYNLQCINLNKRQLIRDKY